MKRIRLFMAALVMAFGLGAAAPAVGFAAANPKSDVCNALDSGNDCNTSANGLNLTTVVKVVVNILSVIVGIIAVIMLIVGGLRYITSGGDSNNVASAKNTIMYALIGIVVVAMAQFIVQFVLNKLGNGVGKKGLVTTEQYASLPAPGRYVLNYERR